MHIELDEGYPGHRKTLRLCALMKCDTADAYPPRLWAWATRSASDGDLTGMSPTEVELALRFRGKAGVLFDALVGAGFIDQAPDGSTTIHNWADRTGAAITRMEQAAKASRDRKRAWREGRGNTNVPGTSPGQERDGDVKGQRPGTVPDKASPGQSRQGQSSPGSDQRSESAETASPSSTPVMVFPCDGPLREWALTQEQVDEWTGLFPSLDVMAICRQALAWAKATPAKRKTASGMPRFLVAWLTRDQNRGNGPTPLAGARAAATRPDRVIEGGKQWLESKGEVG